MPFDVRDFPGVPPDERAASRGNRRLVALWLFSVCAMILVMVVLGGITRLAGAGLSIMEWAPIRGALPPMSQTAWEHLFALYQQTPQYQLVNHGMGLTGFKGIFWLEWAHRLWGRLIGAAFLLPLIWLWASGRIQRRLCPRLVLIFALGGLQGAVGWFMVEFRIFRRSGLRGTRPAGDSPRAGAVAIRHHPLDGDGPVVAHPRPGGGASLGA